MNLTLTRRSPKLHAMNDFDAVVVGGGVVGSAIAWGLAGGGVRACVLDEGDVAHRASRGNFALVWVHSKGLGMAPYSAWTMRSADAWDGFAQTLRAQTGIDVAFRRSGGFNLVLSEAEWHARKDLLERLQNQPGMRPFAWEMLDHAAVAKLMPQIGPQVAGGSYSQYDGHCNALKLLRALNQAMQQLRVSYRAEHRVQKIEHRGGEFRISTAQGELRAGKVVLAAGLDNARLGAMVGLAIPVRAERGQLIVTEKTKPFLPYAMSKVRQTDEGGVMIGDSQEDAGLDDRVTVPVAAALAQRAVRVFPQLASLKIVRTWACLRVMTPDRFPVYDQSETCPGAFSAACHSGVTLAAAHALHLAPHIARGALPDTQFQPFSSTRFHVQPVAA